MISLCFAKNRVFTCQLISVTCISCKTLSHLLPLFTYTFKFIFHIDYMYQRLLMLKVKKKKTTLLSSSICAFFYLSFLLFSCHVLIIPSPVHWLLGTATYPVMFLQESFHCMPLLLSPISLWLWLAPILDYYQFFLLLLIRQDCTSLPL